MKIEYNRESGVITDGIRKWSIGGDKRTTTGEVARWVTLWDNLIYQKELHKCPTGSKWIGVQGVVLLEVSQEYFNLIIDGLIQDGFAISL